MRTKTLRIVGRGLAALGALLIVLILGGFVPDVMAFDRTRGGYGPPYTGYTGTPIDTGTRST